MIAVALVIVSALLCCTVYILALALNRLQWANEEIVMAVDTNHAKCMGAVMSYVGDEFAAQILAVAAEDFDSPQGAMDRTRISRLLYRPDGPSVTALWLHERAEKLRIGAVDLRTETLAEVSR